MVRGAFLLAALLLPWAGAGAVEDLSAALLKARAWAVRGPAEVTVLFPPRAVPTRTVNQLPAVPFRPALIARNFDVVQGPEVEIAGRSATRYDLTPKVGTAARWTLWVDRGWNVPVAFEERSAGGDLARRAALTGAARLVRVARPAPGIPGGLRAAVLAALPGLALPPGFGPVSAARRAPDALEVTLSDGANTLALVLAPRGVRAAPGVASRRVGAGFVWLVGNLDSDALGAALAPVRAVRPQALGTFVPAADSQQVRPTP